MCGFSIDQFHFVYPMNAIFWKPMYINDKMVIVLYLAKTFLKKKKIWHVSNEDTTSIYYFYFFALFSVRFVQFFPSLFFLYELYRPESQN